MVPDGQTFPHEPQLWSSYRVSRHTPPQHVFPSPQGGSHGTSTQEPFTQAKAGSQAFAHEPQCLLSVKTSVHPELQHCFGGSHFIDELQAHIPVMHMFPRGEHACPQPPQLSKSVLVLTQTPEQQVNPDGHVPCSSQVNISSSSKMSPVLSVSISCLPKSFLTSSFWFVPVAQKFKDIIIKIVTGIKNRLYFL